MKKFSKKIIAVIVITAFVCGFAPLLDFDNIAFAAITEYTDGDFIFTLDNSLATIKSYGGNSETVQVPEKVSDGEFEYTVTKIGNKAFAGCESVKSITLPESVCELGGALFENSGVTEVVVKGRIIKAETTQPSNQNGPFYGSKVKTVTMEQSNIPRCMFSGCTTVETINLPESIKNTDDNIGCYAFYNCQSLQAINIPEGITKLGKVGYVEEGNVFANCKSLTSIDIPNTVTSIAMYAFAGCEGVKSITFPESVCELGGALFENSGVKEVVIKGRITKVGTTQPSNYNGPFYGSKVKTVTMEQSNIPRCMFSGCTTVETINLPESIKNTDDNIGGYAFNDCQDLVSVDIPEGITTIGTSAFSNCQDLTSIVIPSSVNEISEKVFYGCSNLQYIHFNSAVCEYSLLCDNLSTVLCTSVADNPLGLIVCEHEISSEEPETPVVPDIPAEPEIIEKPSSNGNGIVVEYDSSYFENNDEIVVKAEEKSVFDSSFSEYDEDADAIKHYDIHLEYSNGTIAKSENTETEFTVKIPVPAGYEHYTEFLIKHRMTHEDGSKSVERIYGKVDGGYIVFKTKSFSDFIVCDFGFESDSISLNYKSSAVVSATKGDVDVVYTSSNPDVATVDENGNVIARGRGTAIITATVTTDDGETITDTCTVKVDFSIVQWIIYILLLGFFWY